VVARESALARAPEKVDKNAMRTSKNLTRRTFLRTAVGAGAAPFILPSHIWAADVKPNDRIALGFIGMGKQNRGLMGDFLGRKETQTIAVCDVDTHRRERAKKTVEDHYAGQTDSGTYKGCAAYYDFRGLIGRKDIDAVVIATPDHWHAIIAIAAANARKHIYCEKPLCQSIHESQAMVKAVRKNNVVFQTGSMQRSSNEFRTACELVRNGVIGNIERVEVAVGGPGVPCDLPTEPAEPGLDWERWLGPAPARGYHSELSPRGIHDHFPNWRRYREYGGGMVTDWGAHHFDIAQWGLGMDDSGPVEIIPPPDWEKAQSGVRLLYAKGPEVIHTPGNGIWFFGADGKVYVNRGKFELWKGSEQKASSPKDCDTVAADHLTNAKVRLYRSEDHKGDWLSCLQSRKRPICDVEVGAHTVIVCHLINLAYYHGQAMKWDPKKENFVGGTGEASWLDVPHREPWSVS
jgi:predicted dehydrogenase